MCDDSTVKEKYIKQNEKRNVLIIYKTFCSHCKQGHFLLIIHTQNTRQLIVLIQWNSRVKPAKQKGADWAGFTPQAEESTKQ